MLEMKVGVQHDVTSMLLISSSETSLNINTAFHGTEFLQNK